MGIIPPFDCGEANAFFIGEINFNQKKAKSRPKVLEPFEDSSKNSSMINAILISYVCFYKRLSKPVMKGSMLESFEEARNKYKKLLEERCGKTLCIH